MGYKKVEKAKRGRPKKIQPLDETVKRKRGRPRKNPLPVETTVQKKRGRPKKNCVFANQKSSVDDSVQPLVPLKIGKLIGYCPHCFAGLSTLDSMRNIDPHDTRSDVYFCYRCMKEIQESNFLKEAPKAEPKYRSKKEYLEDCLKIHSEDHAPVIPTETAPDFSDFVPPPDVLGEE